MRVNGPLEVTGALYQQQGSGQTTWRVANHGVPREPKARRRHFCGGWPICGPRRERAWAPAVPDTSDPWQSRLDCRHRDGEAAREAEAVAAKIGVNLRFPLENKPQKNLLRPLLQRSKQ